MRSSRGGSAEGRRVDSRHPNARLVGLEQIGDQLVEIDIGVGVVVEGQLLPVKLEFSVQNFHRQPMFDHLLNCDALCLCLCALFVLQALDLMFLCLAAEHPRLQFLLTQGSSRT